MDGFMRLEEVQARLGIIPPMREGDQSFQTLAGFMLAHGEDPPQMGRHFEWGGFHFEIVDMDGMRIDRILVAPLPNKDDSQYP